ncbi:MAG: accessory factor UbiK family protein [Gammaproteobacteria bacterium]|nr:accessory factor UbiK family protein [Gammaproteobacteria bacterium]
MIDNATIDSITRKLSSVLPEGVKLVQQDIENNIRSVLEAAFSKMNLVSREEFDVQSRLLTRTLEQLQELERKVSELENR